MIVHVCSITLRNNIANPLPPVRVFRVSCGAFPGGGGGRAGFKRATPRETSTLISRRPVIEARRNP